MTALRGCPLDAGLADADLSHYRRPGIIRQGDAVPGAFGTHLPLGVAGFREPCGLPLGLPDFPFAKCPTCFLPVLAGAIQRPIRKLCGVIARILGPQPAPIVCVKPADPIRSRSRDLLQGTA